MLIAIIIWVIGVFLLHVSCKCGLEQWLDKRGLYDDVLIPVACVFWPIVIPVGIPGAGLIYCFYKAWELAVEFVVSKLCPNREKLP